MSMSALALICILGGVLLVGALNDAFLERATDVLLEGTKYAAIVFKGIG